MASGGMMYIPSLMAIGSDVQVILRLLPQLFESLQCWYNWWEGFVKYAVEMASGGMVFVRNFIKIGAGIQKLLGVEQICRCTDAHTDSKHKPTAIFFKISNVSYINIFSAGQNAVVCTEQLFQTFETIACLGGGGGCLVTERHRGSPEFDFHLFARQTAVHFCSVCVSKLRALHPNDGPLQSRCLCLSHLFFAFLFYYFLSQVSQFIFF
jgi:hypothetical protein